MPQEEKNVSNRKDCETCLVHDALVEKLDILADKLDKMVNEVRDLKWVKSIGRFLIGIMVTFLITAFPLTWKMFDKTTDLMIRVDKNSNASDQNHEYIEKLAVDVKSELRDLKVAVEKTNSLVIQHMTDSSKHINNPYQQNYIPPNNVKIQ